MCLDFPGRVVERNGDVVLVNCAGRERRASTLLYPTVRIGDWVYVAFGTVIERIDEGTVQDLNRDIAIAKGVAP